MSPIDAMKKLSSAEDFFHYLKVPFETSVLQVARLHILKRMGEYLRNTPPQASDEEIFEHSRGYLLRAYLDFIESTPMEQRVFKVHQQAIRKPEAPLVSIQS